MAAKHALVGGGTGFIGKNLTKLLSENGYKITVVSRMPAPDRITWHDLADKGVPKEVTTVINLAGQNVLDPSRRWTPGFKQNVWNSRINTTQSMAKAIEKAEGKVKTFINISGVSLYKPSDKVYNENDAGEEYDFMSKLCLEWEKAATLPTECNCRLVKIRTGVVIGRGGGMIQSIYLPFFLGLGGPMGSGKQPLPWIHMHDLCKLIHFCAEKEQVCGPLNAVAPELVTNEQFSKAYATAMRRPALFPVPEIAVDFLFGKERAALLLAGAKIEPKRTLEVGFQFKYPTAKAACDEVVKNKSSDG